jgi:hypothetical protein
LIEVGKQGLLPPAEKVMPALEPEIEHFVMANQLDVPPSLVGLPVVVRIQAF